ncbi:tRNA glutamyl-Q(34) synthetase GluQRS [Gilliamella sp. B2776]|uniref:tRNA glutamyl-Q(34) synthetase GluQRS n=1 Tax=unclassified Gilliamella TaxID=2685620 RepID=UPI00226A103C|nr:MULTISPECIES: tRNA glutamyl-Q(34) synthetase GluQRS [unclassified Gilliamella]MCX8650408.1 tRNA glutamyl-Q(34) synthetase GluQRS [Gilliamella sp. B2779]MCX8654619.1 tRNA glutamyl-Q(34) synthetase GluQRS [Gilliamella sp. B2737]MCX8656660.1 tRNA glutamyl-Q(34) synthetase GluQRS [Gilliamella sp. B2894]MCX8665256.1 tRNA glutamyl-Q(34) synthetase GluQRS [Gilliamella sp. B2887]MCX8692181.1 tRNA glutamyl-Q(34) synthetase GluQRS [Gilliamella sp. B2776]
MQYIGRFAPSPSGPLHFGSLVTALGSYLQAKYCRGKWLVRIEDIDPPREVKGASTLILKTLEALNLYWDDEILYQSNCCKRYKTVLQSLLNKQQAYYCDCTRQRIHSLANKIYDGFCRDRPLSVINSEHMAIRIKQNHPVLAFTDKIRGKQTVQQADALEDFIIHRKKGLFAYNLVVVLDDHEQGITEIVRGADLLPVTTKHISLYQLLGFNVPTYCHLPLALDKNGNKLSKQNHASPIDLNNLKALTVQALQFLGQKVPKDWQDASQQQLLDWAIQHWQLTNIPKHNASYPPI